MPATRPPVFSMAEEDELVRHIKDLESQGFGIGLQAVCKLAYDMAEHAGVKHRFSHAKKSAGYDWYRGFMERHPNLSLRKPEGLSAARASMLNPTTTADHTVGTVSHKWGTRRKCNCIDMCQCHWLCTTSLSSSRVSAFMQA